MTELKAEGRLLPATFLREALSIPEMFRENSSLSKLFKERLLTDEKGLPLPERFASFFELLTIYRGEDVYE